MKFEKKEKAAAEIPTASMPDIIFMLLIFFMVSAVFKEFRGLPVTLPSAKNDREAGNKTERGLHLYR